MGPIIILIIVGLLLLLVETLLIPGFAITGILGLGCMGAACWLAFTRISTTAGVIVTVICILLALGLLIWVLRSSTWKKATLNTNIDAKVDVNAGQEGIAVGTKGTTITRLAPMGMVRLENGTKVEVSSSEGFIDPGCPVEVSAVEGEKIFIKKL
ncbi:MAG: NfeD family protein [Bacteroidales bacterium]|nr:NfeD family protein [Bacteroidales bacterium]